MLVVGYTGVILAGTILLMLPISAAPGRQTSFINALFTATSAVCVTGLIVLDIPAHFSLFGQVVILFLIQVGGLGYMTITSLLALVIGRRISLKERLVLQEGLNQLTMQGLVRFVAKVVRVTLLIEVTAALLLTLRWLLEFPLPKAAMFGLFHAVSAFNNAGFSLFSDSLMAYRADVVVVFVITSSIILGGIGFNVITECWERVRDRKFNLPMSLHARLALTVTATLIIAGTLLLLAVERQNPETLRPLSAWGKLLAAYFQAVTPRTGGFNTIEIGAMAPISLFVLILLMFIGASPGGTGGGIKTTTFGAITVSIWSALLGRTEVNLFGRRLSPEVIAKAFNLSALSFMLVNGVAIWLLTIERQAFLPLLFEVTSAFGTVGLSVGLPDAPVSLSGAFSFLGKLLIVLTMFFGRVGPVTVGAALLAQTSEPRYRFPEDRVPIG